MPDKKSISRRAVVFLFQRSTPMRGTCTFCGSMHEDYPWEARFLNVEGASGLVCRDCIEDPERVGDCLRSLAVMCEQRAAWCRTAAELDWQLPPIELVEELEEPEVPFS